MKKLTLFIVTFLLCALAAAQTGTQNNSTMASSQQITNGPVAEVIADSSATVGWSVRSAGNMSIKYGTERDHLTETATATASTDGRNYHAQIQGLSPSTRYYFQVLQDGQPVGGIGTFHTTARGEAPIKSKAVIPQ